MSMRYLGGFITASYNPLKVPNAPTIGTATAGNTSASVTFTAPFNVGGGAITSYIAAATKTSDGTVVTATGTSSPITVTGLTDGSAYTIQVVAVNTYGTSAYSTPSGSVTPVSPKLFSWGSNIAGELGQNDLISRSSPVQVGLLTNWSKIQVSAFTLAIKLDGTLWGWGDNNSGALGLNNTVNRSSPVQVGALTNWSNVAVGAQFSITTKTDGTLWSWGSNSYGQLGLNDTVKRSSPVQVGTLTTWSQVSTGSFLSGAIKTDGTLWTWGANDFGQLGQNVNYADNKSSPVQVGTLTNWSKLSCGYNNAFAIKTDGTLWGWGRNNYGQLGQQNDRVDRSSPVQIGALTTWSQISAGDGHVIAIKTDGTLWTWGMNSNGQLGLNDKVDRSSPVQVGLLNTWSSVSANNNFSTSIKTDGTLWSWGSNSAGQLGQGNTGFRSSPVQVGANITWLSTSAGGNCVLATSS